MKSMQMFAENAEECVHIDTQNQVIQIMCSFIYIQTSLCVTVINLFDCT